MRMGYKSIIGIYRGKVYLENVSFTNITTSNRGYVIQNYPGGNTNSFIPSFDYHGGSVTLLNNGYEILQTNSLCSFMSLSYITLVNITDVIFSYNILSGGSTFLIKLTNVLITEIGNSIFKYNFSPNYLIQIDQSGLSMPNDYKQSKNIYVYNTTFQYNAASSIIYSNYNKDCQNILLTNNTYYYNIVSNLINILNQDANTNNCLTGYWMNVTNSSFSYNSASTILNWNNLNCSTYLNTLQFQGNGLSLN